MSRHIDRLVSVAIALTALAVIKKVLWDTMCLGWLIGTVIAVLLTWIWRPSKELE